MVECDTNGDGKIAGAELDKHPGLKAAISRLDPSGKGQVTREMISTRIKAWDKSKLGGMAIGCTVTRNGKPLESATVKFVPEKFLGTWSSTAAGETDKNGQARLSVPVPSDLPADMRPPPGVRLGFYRVEITKPGERIPAKYNTDTILGQEVAMDAIALGEVLNFDLSY
jgi:hypothetical protein